MHETVKAENTLKRIKGILVYRTIIKVIRLDQIQVYRLIQTKSIQMSELYVILLKNKKTCEKFTEIWNPGREKQGKEATAPGEQPGEGQVWRSGVQAPDKQTAVIAKNHCSLVRPPDPQTRIQIVPLSSIINNLGGNTVQRPTPTTLAHGSLRQKDHQSEASLSYKAKPWPQNQTLCQKQTNKQPTKTEQINKVGWFHS